MADVALTPEQERLLELRKQLLALISELPSIEQIKYEAFLQAMELREEYSALMSQRDANMTSADLEEALLKTKKKKDALNEMLDLDKQLQELYKNLSYEEKQEFEASGSGIRSIAKIRAEKNLTNSKKNRNDNNNGTSGTGKDVADGQDQVGTQG